MPAPMRLPGRVPEGETGPAGPPPQRLAVPQQAFPDGASLLPAGRRFRPGPPAGTGERPFAPSGGSNWTEKSITEESFT